MLNRFLQESFTPPVDTPWGANDMEGLIKVLVNPLSTGLQICILVARGHTVCTHAWQPYWIQS